MQPLTALITLLLLASTTSFVFAEQKHFTKDCTYLGRTSSDGRHYGREGTYLGLTESVQKEK